MIDRNVVDGNQQLATRYIAVLAGYQTPEAISIPSLHDFQDPNRAWKLHLNVAPEHVKEVSTYLLSSGYYHKYLSGANIDRGKIFTVYVGSKSLTERLVPQIWEAVGHLLDEPKDDNEIKVAPKIIARFGLTDHPSFPQSYYFKGTPILKVFDPDLCDLDYARAESVKYLQNEFGDYFGGKIEYYDPTIPNQSVRL